MVTGLATAAVHGAVTCIVGEAERWTEGSLTVQLEFTSAEAFTAHTALPVKRPEALKVVPLPGAAAVWSTVIEPGVTLKAVNVQLEEEKFPPQPAIPNNAAQNRTDVNILRGNMVDLPFIVELKENFTPNLLGWPELSKGLQSPDHESLPSLTLGSSLIIGSASCRSNSRQLSGQLASRRDTALGRGPNQGSPGCHGSHHGNV